jgi:hypothetical protein
MAKEFVLLDDLFVAFEASLARAGERMAERGDEIQFAVGECTIAFPAELQMDPERIVARSPPPPEAEEPAVPEANLARITLTLRPTVAFEGRRE